MGHRFAMVAAALSLAGCQPLPPEVEDAWVRLPAVPGRPAAGYFTIEGGERSELLVAVRSPAAGRVELHESMAGGMRALNDVALPAKQTVRFAPGGRHLMLFDLAPGLAAGSKVRFDVELGTGATLPVEAEVVGPADPAP